MRLEKGYNKNMRAGPFFISVGLSTAISLASFLAVLILIDPEESGYLGLGLLLGTFFAFLVGFFSVLGVFFRSRFKERRHLGKVPPSYYERKTRRNLKVSFRQAFLLGIAIIGILLLQRFDAFSMLGAGLLGAGIVISEAYIDFRKR